MKNLILLVFHLLTDAVSTILMPFYSSGPRLLVGLDTLRRRPYKVVYCFYEKLVFYQLTLLFLAILKLFKVSLEVGFVLKFKVEFESIKLTKLELITRRFLIGLFKGEERDISPVEEDSLSFLNN